MGDPGPFVSAEFSLFSRPIPKIETVASLPPLYYPSQPQTVSGGGAHLEWPQPQSYGGGHPAVAHAQNVSYASAVRTPVQPRPPPFAEMAVASVISFGLPTNDSVMRELSSAVAPPFFEGASSGPSFISPFAGQWVNRAPQPNSVQEWPQFGAPLTVRGHDLLARAKAVGNPDVVLPATVMKSIFTSNLGSGDVSLAVHNFGGTLVLDEIPAPQEGTLSTSEIDLTWEVPLDDDDSSCSEGEEPAQFFCDDDGALVPTASPVLAAGSPPRVPECAFDLPQPSSECLSLVTLATSSPDKLRPASPSPSPGPDLHMVKLGHLTMAIGSSLPSYSAPNNDAVSVRVVNRGSVSEDDDLLSVWLDAVLAAVPELAVCWCWARGGFR